MVGQEITQLWVHKISVEELLHLLLITKLEQQNTIFLVLAYRIGFFWECYDEQH